MCVWPASCKPPRPAGGWLPATDRRMDGQTAGKPGWPHKGVCRSRAESAGRSHRHTWLRDKAGRQRHGGGTITLISSPKCCHGGAAPSLAGLHPAGSGSTLQERPHQLQRGRAGVRPHSFHPCGGHGAGPHLERGAKPGRRRGKRRCQGKGDAPAPAPGHQTRPYPTSQEKSKLWKLVRASAPASEPWQGWSEPRVRLDFQLRSDVKRQRFNEPGCGAYPGRILMKPRCQSTSERNAGD